jgi:hypothetical protein
MPSQLHESHLLLFRNQPTLAVELIRGALHVDVPLYKEARVVSADLTDMQPAEYRADMVIQLIDEASVFGIVVEVQLSADERKRFVWPAYVANPVLSAMAHGRDEDYERSARVAAAAQSATTGLDADRSKLYFDLIISSLSEAARHALKNMDAHSYEYQSDFARHYVAQGRAEGRVALVSRLLSVRFGPLSGEAQCRISRASVAELDAIGERLLIARSLHEALGPG